MSTRSLSGALALCCSFLPVAASAFPQLDFDGTVTYSVVTPSTGSTFGHLLVTGSLVGFDDIADPSNAIGPLVGTSLRIEAKLDLTDPTSVGIDATGQFVTGFFSSFGLSDNPLTPNINEAYSLEVRKANNGLIVGGELIAPKALQMFGLLTSSFGFISAYIAPDALNGTLGSAFSNPSSVLALVLNASEPFSPTTFDADFFGTTASSGISFSAQVDGNLSGVVPLPAGLPLLVTALAVPFGARLKRRA